MKAPSWWNNAGVMSYVMQPLSCIYGAVSAARSAFITPKKVKVPVLCVGNVTVGGTGKTPTVMSLAYKLTAMGERPHVISRGYGGFIKETTLVDVTMHNADDVGDEPLLVSKAAPCWIGSDRVDSARAAIARGATVLVMDDGFQNPALVKDKSIIVVDGGYGFGNGKMLPAGPLRESLKPALARADMMLIIGDDIHDAAKKAGKLPVMHAMMEPQATLGKGEYIAFAGIGRPEKFYETLRALGTTLVDTQDFPDHYSYSNHDIEGLLDKAKSLSATLITTEKDAVKIDDTYLEHIAVLPVTLEWGEGTAQIDAMLESLMQDGGV